jgi:hypothetical protein
VKLRVYKNLKEKSGKVGLEAKFNSWEIGIYFSLLFKEEIMSKYELIKSHHSPK